MVQFNPPLRYDHSFFAVADDEGRLRAPEWAFTIRDANDYERFHSEGEDRPELAATKLWQRRGQQPPLASFINTSGADHNLECIYLTDVYLRECTIACSVLYNVQADLCHFRHCHIHFTHYQDVSDCMFTNCVLTTSSNSGVVICSDTLLENCTLAGNFAEDVGQSTLNRVAKYPRWTQIGPYEVHTNVVFKDVVVRCLRRYIEGFRQRKTDPQKKSALAHRGVLNGKTAASKRLARVSNGAIGEKASGKRPLIVNEVYDIESQLDLPERRSEWSVERTKETKRRKIKHYTHFNGIGAR